MKKILKISFVGIAAVFAGIQLIPVERSNPPVVSDLNAPLEVKQILMRSCYDCHSNETQWPWYSYVAPVSWLVSHDVVEGREYLNFSNWERHANNSHMKEEIIEEMQEGEMPLGIYLLTHPKAAVSEDEISLVQAWLGVSVGEGQHEDHDNH